MTSNSPACSTLSWDTTSNHRSSHRHDSDSWKTFTTFQNNNHNFNNRNNLYNSDNQSNLTANPSSNGNDSYSTVYTYGPIDGNLYATVSKPNKSSVSCNKPTQTHQYHLNSSNEQLPPSSSQKTGDMSYNESHIRSSIDSGISSVNSIGNSRPMASVSTFLSPSTNMNGKTSILRQSSETNNNTVMPNGYKSGSVVNVEAIVHHKPESIVEMHRPANPSENYCNGKSSDGNFSSFTSNTISGISEAEQAALDELLSGMLKEVENFPDYPMHSPNLKRSIDNQPIHNYNNKVNSSITNNYNKNISLENNEYIKTTGKPESPSIDAVDSFTNSDETGTDEPVRVASPQLPPLTDHFGKIEPLPVRFLTKAPPTSGEDERGRPYHARPGSQPFSYGVTATSPALQRRRVVSETTAYICESRPKPDTAVSTSVPASNDTTQPVSPLPETTPDSTINSLDESSVSIEEQVISNGHHKYHLIDDEDTSGLTWLQKQQLKLKNKHESKDLRGKDLVLAELKGTIARHENVSSMVDRTPDSRSSSPSQHRFTTATSSSPISRSPLVLPNLTASPILRSPQPVQSSTNYHSSPPTPSTPPTPAPSEPPLSQSIVSNQATTMMSSLNLNDKSRQSPSLASSPTSPTYSRPLHVSTFEPRTSIGSNNGTTTNNDSPSTPNLSAGGKPPLNAMTRQNSIPSTPPHRYVSASGSVSPLTYSQIRDNYGRTPSSPEPGRDSPSVYFGQSQRSSMLSLNESDIISQHPTFIKDTSKFWYKPKIPREDAIKILLDKPPGTFIIRDSNSFPGAFGLALKVAQPPPDVQTKSGDTSHELVRHFLIEPTSKGVRIKGCPNEPVFASLSALVYQHSITPLALSCKLIIPDSDLTLSRGPSGTLLTSGMIGTLSRITGVTEAADILAQGAACNVLYLLTVETESLTGPLAVRNAVTELISRTNLNEIIVNFKVSNSGITLTDNSHRNFFRRHYPLATVSHFGLDPEGRCYKPKTANTRTSQLFGFVARARGINKPSNNECHLFVEFDEDQAASAIVNFANKVILSVNRDDRRK